MIVHNDYVMEGRALNSELEMKSFKDFQKLFNEAKSAEQKGDMKLANKKYKECKTAVESLIKEYNKMPEDDFWDKIGVITSTNGYLRTFSIAKNKHSAKDHATQMRQINLAFLDFKVKQTNGENVTYFKDYFMKNYGSVLKYNLTGRTSTYDDKTGKFIPNK